MTKHLSTTETFSDIIRHVKIKKGTPFSQGTQFSSGVTRAPLNSPGTWAAGFEYHCVRQGGGPNPFQKGEAAAGSGYQDLGRGPQSQHGEGLVGPGGNGNQA